VAIVSTNSARAVRWTNGRDAVAADIRVGDDIGVWFRSPARESYPVQADADAIVIKERSR
jgi:hypothetical protein